MKKILNKLPIKLLKPKQSPLPPSRITNETVAEHRERILAGGRKFKYPVQYARHKLVFNAIIISLAAAILLAAIAWWQLYPMQNSSALMYRITLLLPLPVANVDGEQVPYRDYLVHYRGSEYYLAKYGDIKLDSEDGKIQLDHIKRQSLEKAEQIAYARKLSRSVNVKVTDSDVDAFIDQERNASNGKTSQETYDASAQMIFGLSSEDYRLSVANAILKIKVSFAVDAAATAQAKKAGELIKSTDGDFTKISEQMTDAKVTVGQSGLVDASGKFRGLRVADVAKLATGELSGLLRSTTSEGYYYVRVVSKTDSQVDFVYLHIPLSKFDSDFARLKSTDKITEYIKVADQQ